MQISCIHKFRSQFPDPDGIESCFPSPHSLWNNNQNTVSRICNSRKTHFTLHRSIELNIYLKSACLLYNASSGARLFPCTFISWRMPLHPGGRIPCGTLQSITFTRSFSVSHHFNQSEVIWLEFSLDEIFSLISLCTEESYSMPLVKSVWDVKYFIFVSSIFFYLCFV